MLSTQLVDPARRPNSSTQLSSLNPWLKLVDPARRPSSLTQLVDAARRPNSSTQPCSYMRRGFLLQKKKAPLRSEHCCNAPEHAVFCLMASRLTFLTCETSVLFLCRQQERARKPLVNAMLYCQHIAMIDDALKEFTLYEHSMTPMGQLLRTNREPCRFLLTRLYYQGLGIPFKQMFFCLWHAVTFFFPEGRALERSISAAHLIAFQNRAH